MTNRVTMPALGESVTEGTVTRWLKQVGEQVAVDEPLVEVSTDKVDTEIPSPFAGVLEEILVQEDETAEVGADLAVIGDGSGGGGSPSGEADRPDPTEGHEQAPHQTPDEEATSEAVPSAEAEPDEDNSEPEASSESGSESGPQDGSQEKSEPEAKPASSGGSGGSGGGDGQQVMMPALGESVTEGTVTRWLKQVGDEVAVDEPLVEVSTDKVDTEIPSPYAGTLSEILVQEDETAQVGAALAVIGGSGGGSSPAAEQPEKEEAPEPQEEPQQQEAPKEQAPQAEEPKQAAQGAQAAQQEPKDEEPTSQAPKAEAPKQQASQDSGQEQGSSSEGDSGVYVTPLVRKLAQQHGIDLGSLQGTGVGGRIRKQDVLDAAEAAKAPAEPEPATPAAAPAAAPAKPAASAGGDPNAAAKRGSTEKMSRLRKVIAQRMLESLQVSAQLTTVIEVDLTKVARLRARSKEAFAQREGVSLSYLPFLAIAACEALKAHPMVNASVDGDSIVYHGQENLSIAVDTEKGLIVPVIKNAGDLNIAGLARAIADVAERTRTNKITPDDLSGGTFTITNTGSRGALFDTPIINQPQVAILGTGALVKRPVVVDDGEGGETIAIRSMMYLALSYDHRIVDGADAARFLGTMKARLEEGHFEAQLGI